MQYFFHKLCLILYLFIYFLFTDDYVKNKESINMPFRLKIKPI